ncbi:hypothetical protein FACS1894204_07610 [Synergistales bacterium]|nr:hypothetical protein FACS1894204_07610 [Synergistales bacterium]
MVTLWSNIPYAMSLLFLTTVIIEIMHAKDISTWTLFKLALALPLTFTTRSEGFVPAILTIAFIFIFALRKPIKPKLILATVTGCVLIALIQGPLYYNLTTRSQEKGPIVAASSVLFLDGIQSVLYFGGDLAPETTAYLERFAPISDWKSAYNIYNTNYRGKLHQSLRKSHIATAEFASAVKEHYLKTLVREPFLLIQNRINKSNLVWDITQPDNVYGMERVSTEIYQHKYFNFPRHENMLTTVITRFVYPITVYIAPLDVLLYRSGIYVILSMLLCVYLSVHEMRKYLAAFIPMLGGILALLVSMAWPNYRYIWFIPVIFTFIAPYLLSCRKSQ